MTAEGPVLDLSVIIPCYNEARNIESGALEEVDAYLSQQTFTWEVIVVNDESTDDSRRLVEAFVRGRQGYTLLDVPHGGKPSAVWAGIRQARGEIVLFADMDQSTPIAEWDNLYPWYAQGYDVVIGSRGGGREGFSPLRQAGSLVFRQLRGLFLLPGIQDTQCGFKSCRLRVALEAFPKLEFLRRQERPSGWRVTAYDVELLYLAQRADYRLKEVPVQWSNRDRSHTKGQSSEMGRYLRESVEMTREILKVKWNDLRGVYDRPSGSAAPPER